MHFSKSEVLEQRAKNWAWYIIYLAKPIKLNTIELRE